MAAIRKVLPGSLRDIPITSSIMFDEVSQLRSALWMMERGEFNLAAQLCDNFGSDDRIKGVLDTRVDALFGLPLELTPYGDARRSESVVKRLSSEFTATFPAAELKQFLRWGVLLRTSFGRFDAVERTATATKYAFRCWDPRHVRWDWDTRSFWTRTDGGKDVEITPGRNGWIVYAPDGLQRGWMHGLVRALGALFLVRKWGWRDWARFSEVHGLPIRVIEVPAGASEEDKAAMESDVANIGSEAVIRVATDENGKGFGIKLVEANSQSWEGFQKLIEKADECIAVAVLGQNLTTSAKSGGSYALGSVHDRIRLDRLEGDAQSLGACLREQGVAQWAESNFGSRELAPMVGWSSKAPEDRAATATTLKTAGEALKTLGEAGIAVDKDEFVKVFRIPVSESWDEEDDPEPDDEPDDEPDTESDEPAEQDDEREPEDA